MRGGPLRSRVRPCRTLSFHPGSCSQNLGAERLAPLTFTPAGQGLPVESRGFESRAAAALSQLGTDAEQLVGVVDAVDEIVADTRVALHKG